MGFFEIHDFWHSWKIPLSQTNNDPLTSRWVLGFFLNTMGFWLNGLRRKSTLKNYPKRLYCLGNGITAQNRHFWFAGPLPRACQIISNVLLTSNFCICPPAFFRKNAIETNLNSIFEHRTWARAAMFEICARTVVSCLRSAHARRLLWEPPDMFIVFCFDVRGPFFRSHFRYICFLKNGAKWTPTWLQKLRKSYQKWHLKWSRKNMHEMC